MPKGPKSGPKLDLFLKLLYQFLKELDCLNWKQCLNKNILYAWHTDTYLVLCADWFRKIPGTLLKLPVSLYISKKTKKNCVSLQTPLSQRNSKSWCKYYFSHIKSKKFKSINIQKTSRQDVPWNVSCKIFVEIGLIYTYFNLK